MNRRDVLKCFSGLFLAPIIRLDLTHERDLSALVGEFCDNGIESVRYDLTEPWGHDGQSVATDARAMIAIPGLRYVSTGEEKRRPDAGYVFRSFWPEDGVKWHRMPKVERYTSYNIDFCPACSRSHSCAVCEGEGTIPTPFDAEEEEYWWWHRDCRACKGRGYFPQADCQICHGALAAIAWKEAFGDQLINARYATLIRQIPGAMWTPGLEASETGVDYRGPIVVRGDGGIRAFVMPVCEDAR